MKELKEILVFLGLRDPLVHLALGHRVFLALLPPFLGPKGARVIPEFQGIKEIVALGVLTDPQVSQ